MWLAPNKNEPPSPIFCANCTLSTLLAEGLDAWLLWGLALLLLSLDHAQLRHDRLYPFHDHRGGEVCLVWLLQLPAQRRV